MPYSARQMQGGRTLLDICMELHEDNTGSADHLGGPERNGLVLILQRAILDWEPSCLPEWRAFDEAVRQLVLVTLAESNVAAILGGEAKEKRRG